ncbi:MAG: hypothetical protein MK101_01810 [Phycisphaerales bacterium]|nr:hypothetical protein [Phycisphaerales bacterium]
MSQSPYAPPQVPAPGPAPKSKVGRRWHHQINRWLVLNISALNAIVFILICLAGIVFAIIVGRQAYRTEEIALAIVVGVLGFPLAGVLYCGLIALLVEIASQSRRTAELLGERFGR